LEERAIDMNAEIVLTLWAVLLVGWVILCCAVQPGDRRREAEEEDRRRLRNAVLNYRQGEGE
jgi:hypothetical protein